MHNSLDPLRIPNFRKLWTANLANHLTLFIYSMTSLWLAFDLTKSPFFLGLAGFCQSLPMAVVPFIGGAVADRWDRRKVLILCQAGFLINAVCMALLIAGNLVRPWHILVHVALHGTIMSIALPTRQALMANTVPSSVLNQAVTLHFTTQSVTRIMGPAIAGYVIAMAGADTSYVIQSFLYVVAIAFMYRIDLPTDGDPIKHDKPVKHLIEGISYIKSNRLVFYLMGVTGMVGLVGLTYVDMLPVFSTDILGAGSTELGMMMTAGGVGALIGMISLMIVGKAGRRGVILVAMVCVLGISLVTFSSLRHIYPVLIVLAFAGLANTVIRTMNNSLLLEMIPDRLRGRVMGTTSLLNNGLKAIGSISIGVTASTFNAPMAVGLCGSVLIISGLVLSTKFSSITKLN